MALTTRPSAPNWSLRLATEFGFFRRFDDISTTWKDPQHIGLKMFYCRQVSGSPPLPFAGFAARSFGTRAEADRTYRQPDFIVVATTRLSVSCPVCKTPSSRIHSRYQRVLRDFPWHGAIVRMRLLCRLFYCRAPECSCRIFTERIPKVVRRYDRFTERSRQVLSLIGYALGGEAGVRLAEHIGLEMSADTVLRTLKSSAPEESHPPVRVIGVDDWA